MAVIAGYLWLVVLSVLLVLAVLYVPARIACDRYDLAKRSK